MRFANNNNNNNGGSQGCVRAPDATDHDAAALPQPSATSGHGELHELLVAKSTTENNQKGNHGNHAGRSCSLLLVYFVAEVQRHLQARHMYYSASSGSSALVRTDTFLEPIPCGRETFLISTSVRFGLRVDGALFCRVWALRGSEDPIKRCIISALHLP